MRTDLLDIKRHIKRYILALLLVLPLSVTAQTLLDADDSRAVLEYVTQDYQPWETMEISGKLKMDGLPLKSTLKIFLDNGESLVISARAPFVGEALRIECDTVTARIISKMKKVYCELDLRGFSSEAHTGLSNLQDLLLQRLFVPGQNWDGTDGVELFDVFYDGEAEEGVEEYAFLPKTQPMDGELQCGHTAETPGVVTSFIATRQKGNLTLICDYYPRGEKWGDKGVEIDLSLQLGDKEIDAELELDKPKAGASPLAPVNLDKGYVKVDFKEFLKKAF